MGEIGFEREILDERVESIRGLVAALPSLDNPHMEFSLLRSCFAFPKFAFALRTTDTTAHREVREEFDALVRDSLGDILGLALSDAKLEEPSLPVALSGFGLRGVVRHGPAAYLASLSASQPLVKIMRGGPSPSRRRVPLESPEPEGSQADALLGRALGRSPLRPLPLRPQLPAEGPAPAGAGLRHVAAGAVLVRCSGPCFHDIRAFGNRVRLLNPV